MIKYRLYSTTKTAAVIDHLWPTNTTNPTPYQIFHIQANAYDTKHLRKIYHSYVKLYHPDISRNSTVLDKNNSILSPQVKLQRFKSISVAYKQLLSRNIPLSNHYTPYTYPTHYYNAHSNEYSNEYSNAHSHQPDPVDINPWHVYYIVLGTCIVFTGSIYLTNLQNSIHLSNQYTTNSQTVNEQDIKLARWQELYDKYVGSTDNNSKIDRIRRFLWIRLWNDEDVNENDISHSLDENNHLIDCLIKPKK